MNVKRIITGIISTLIVLAAMAKPIFADPIVVNQDVAGSNNFDQSATITVIVSADYYISIPKDITLSGSLVDISYNIKVYGTVMPASVVSVVPDSTLTFLNSNKTKSITGVLVSQTKTSWLGSEILPLASTTTAITNGTVGIAAKKSSFTSDVWTSSLTFRITLS